MSEGMETKGPRPTGRKGLLWASVASGLIVGAVAGLVAGNLAAGFGVGTALGVTFGYALDRRGRR